MATTSNFQDGGLYQTGISGDFVCANQGNVLNVSTTLKKNFRRLDVNYDIQYVPFLTF